MPLLKPAIPDGEVFGVLAEFKTPRDLYHACERVRDAGYRRWDAHSPFPVHGLDRAMGLRPSLLPWLVLVLGLGFALGGMGLQWWTSTVAYPLVISGKPLFSWQAFVPITFELGVLGGALAAVFGMLGLNQLPTLFHPLFNSKRFERVTDDGFFISVESWDPQFDLANTAQFMESVGASNVEIVRREPEGGTTRS
jgi:hypothetical protein